MEATADAPTQKQVVKTATDLFKWSAYVHVGEGAEECPGRSDGSCTDPSHFHAWCRVPNPYQQDEIQEKALAARARRLRQFRDPEGDAFLLMEEEVISTPVEDAIDELVASKWAADQGQARADVESGEGDDDDTYRHIDDDLERYFDLRNQGPDARAEAGAEAEFNDLDKHIERYNNAVSDRFAELESDRRDALRELPVDVLRDELKQHRLDMHGTNAFFRARQIWTIIAGTFKPAPGTAIPKERLLPQGEQSIRDLPEDVWNALKAAYQDLDQAMVKEGGSGNS